MREGREGEGERDWGGGGGGGQQAGRGGGGGGEQAGSFNEKLKQSTACLLIGGMPLPCFQYLIAQLLVHELLAHHNIKFTRCP